MVVTLGRLRLAQGDNVDTVDLDNLALGYAQDRERFIMEGTDMALTTWLRAEAALAVPDELDD